MSTAVTLLTFLTVGLLTEDLRAAAFAVLELVAVAYGVMLGIFVGGAHAVPRKRGATATTTRKTQPTRVQPKPRRR